ncbi:ABC transporter ATP-binding protein [Solirhodobacter olei]|uniref:ABC transporter ATP-binding protein n=1 Tax=Solirhodobacter olei TaxID=2493082 RepID=UPI000FD7C5E4|nr:sn-glycerol-3-phosphate ABC transporter ATP-binding protein UgpC [Solirhodobacter olei]
MAGLRLTNVRKSFGAVDVLHDINLEIDGGEFVVFVGPSGCGKSTLLRVIAGLEESTSGKIQISGRDVTFATPSNRGVAMVFQSYALYPHMSVAENMSFGLKVAKRPKAEITRKVEAASDVLKLRPYLDRRPGQLSGGQRQRVAIGRAIVRDPDVFLFDEPLSNLDAELRVDMRIEIAKLHQELGNTMIYVTHDQVEAMTLADKIVVLRAGRIEQIGAPSDLYNDPDNVFVAGFIGSPRMNFLSATTGQAGELHIGPHRLPGPKLQNALAENTLVTLGARPEHLREARDDEPGVPFTVRFTEYLGGVSYLYGEIGAGAACTVEAHRGRVPQQGEVIRITADPSDLRLFDSKEQRLR